MGHKNKKDHKWVASKEGWKRILRDLPRPSDAYPRGERIGGIAAFGILFLIALLAAPIIEFYRTDLVDMMIVNVGKCDRPTSDAWYGKHCGLCRVEFEDGTRRTICGPVMVGDIRTVGKRK